MDMTIAYIISIKNGVLSFVFSEIEALEGGGLKILLFPTKYNEGPYMPKKDWYCYVYKPFFVILKQPLFLIKSPFCYIKLLMEALRTKSLIDFAIGFDFANEMKKRKVSRIHCHFGGHQLFTGYYCKKILNVPLSVTIHAYELYNNPNLVMFRSSLKLCNNIITISDYNKKLLIEKFGIKSNRIKTIRLFSHKKGDEKKYTKILIVARFTEKKGYDVLFKALKTSDRENIKLWVVGGGELEVEKLARDMGIKDKIIFFGRVPDDVLRELYESCDIFCLPSRTAKSGDKEGIPVSLMEAMSYGKPVISTRHTGIPELVEEVLVEENNVEELAKAIELLADNPELCRKLGERNRKIIEERYSKKNVMKLKEVFLEVYDGTLEKN